MNRCDSDKFKELLIMLLGVYDMDTENVSTAKVWALVFEDYTIQQFEYAVKCYLTDTDQGRFNPKPASLLAYIDGTKAEQKKGIKERATIAWSQIMYEIRATGPYRNPRIDDKQAIAVMAGIGGWAHLCSQTFDELKWTEKRFAEMYETYENTPLDELPSSLEGRAVLVEHKEDQEKKATEAKTALDVIRKKLH